MIAIPRTTVRVAVILGGTALIGCTAVRPAPAYPLPGTEHATPPPYRHIAQGAWTDVGPGNGVSGLLSDEAAADEPVIILAPMVITPGTANEPAPAAESDEEYDPPAPDMSQQPEEEIGAE